ncbi:hypothetical protein SY86_03210 [Erwinia tracheiphila]|uniref:Uncharacterized protein n=1 Tax=Erwinia tracheiphila TaxID=65700 RepID=A0A0M2K6W0_9GAMM|nr:hypothetical protein ETR_00325 [Erwinia tracheiphila PSU-1]KKF34674.1 hypothetical protein SY86_03210 [Erwinia tracheiphila]
MADEKDIMICRQAAKYIILNNIVLFILKEQCLLVFINIHSKGTDPGGRARFLQKSHVSHKKIIYHIVNGFIRTQCHLHRLVDLHPPEDCPDS